MNSKSHLQFIIKSTLGNNGEVNCKVKKKKNLENNEQNLIFDFSSFSREKKVNESLKQWLNYAICGFT